MSEYEDRFRKPMLSLAETLAASRGRKRIGWRRNRIRLIAAAVGIACGFASHDGNLRHDRGTGVEGKRLPTTVSDRIRTSSSKAGGERC
jgi:hypothetical protein